MRFRYVRYCTLSRGTGSIGGIKKMETHNRSENGRSAWVALCAHPNLTDTDSGRDHQRSYSFDAV
jgi:hypothetical protein